MRNLYQLILTTILVSTFAEATVQAQHHDAQSSMKNVDITSFQDVLRRLDALEAENQRLKRSLDETLRTQVSNQPSSQILQTSYSDNCTADGCGEGGYCHHGGWLGKHLGVRRGDWEITPFGQLRGEVIYSQAPQTADAVILFLNPKQPGIDEDQATVHGKTSQLNFRFTGPNYNEWQTGGLILLNFLGPQPIRNQSGANFVNAFGEIKNDDWRFAFGRMFDLFGPIMPSTVNGLQQRGAGNIGLFRGAFHVDRYIRLDQASKLTLSARISQQNILDYTIDPTIRGKDAGWPNIEGRIGFDIGPQCEGDCRFEVGLSGFIGETQAVADTVFNQDVILLAADDVAQGRGAAIDVQWTNPRYGVRGEAFWGQAAGTYFVAALQSTNPNTNEEIRSVGGWGEIFWQMTPQVKTHAGYGIDNPNDDDIGFFSPGDLIGGIRLNEVAWWNVMYSVTQDFELALEVSHRRTKYLGSDFDNRGWLFHFASTLKF